MYITCTYLIHPLNPKATSKPNFGSDPNNYMADEIVVITKRLRDSDLKKCNVILDVRKKEVIKCRSFQLDGKIVREPNYDALLQHFREMYPEQVTKLIEIAAAAK